MRHAKLASSLLLVSGAIACGPLFAQQAASAPEAPRPAVADTVTAPVEPDTRPASNEVPTTIATGVPTTIATGVPTTIATGVPTTIATGVPTTIATGAPAAIVTDVPTTIATGVPTTIATGVPTTIATGIPTTIATGVPAPAVPGALPAAAPGAVSLGATVPATGAVVPATSNIIDPATYQKRTEFDNAPWRFAMEQDGKRMTADEFAAWMEARGVRVARGAAHRPANPTTDGMPARGSAVPVVSAAAPAVPAADVLAPGSVTPTDAWQDVEPAPVPSTDVPGEDEVAG